MGFYARAILPRLLDLAMRHPTARAERARWIPLATGHVLEIGIGSGLNLPYYGPEVLSLTGLDPCPALLVRAGRRARRAGRPVGLLLGTAEALPLPAASVDTVVSTWTLCSVGDPGQVLAEVRRVLRPGGRLVFVEHGRAPDPRVRAWQIRLTPLWRRLAGGCHLNRAVDRLLQEAGFGVEHLDAGYRRGPRLTTYLYCGLAVPAP